MSGLALVSALCGCSSNAPSGANQRPTPLASLPLPSITAPVSASSSASPDRARALPFRSDETYELRIAGGEVVDGSGKKPRRADVLIQKGRVVFVGEVDPSVRATRVIDASSRVVTPGFIDMHSHFDPMGNVEPALAQGITTVVVGQDGVSPSAHIASWLHKVDAAKPRVNAVTLVGHATARQAAGLGTRAHLDEKEDQRLADVVEKALKEGAFGLSTGLEYEPGLEADASELFAMAVPVGAHRGIIMSHLRSEDDDKIEASLKELIAQGRGTGARVHVAHMKVVFGHGEKRAEEILAELDTARGEGVDVSADMYPYDASYTSIAILFPDYAKSGFENAKAHRSKDLLTYLHDRVIRRNGPDATLFGSGELSGKTLAEVAKARGVPFEKVLFDLGPSGASAAYFVMDDALQTRLLLDPFVSIGTDGGGGDPHPRSHGTFTRVIEELVEKRGVLSLEEAIRKMTSLAAHALGLDGERGCLAPGCAADVLVFAPSELHTTADYTHPFVMSEGMREVIVNGVVEREGTNRLRESGGHALSSKR